MLSFRALVLMGLTIPVFAQAKTPRFEGLAQHFDYDRKASLDVREVGRSKRSEVTIVALID